MSSDISSNRVALPIVGGIQVVVPDSLDLITPYVLQEQKDWFEDEIKFVRKCIRPGMKAIDIGANYGVYALTLACLVGRKGDIWAFEPDSQTAAYLEESAKINGFENITLVKAALSNRNGKARLGLNKNSEINSLLPLSSGMSEEVALMSLDACMDKYDWRDIAFVKLDAEGEEVKILEGGSRFFAETSPIVMFEIKHDRKFNLPLVEIFHSKGYEIFRFVPGLQVLAPFQIGEKPDPYLLNLFACKADRAQSLEMDALLVSESVTELNISDLRKHCFDKLQEMPYGKRFNDAWRKLAVRPDGDKYLEALDLYFSSKEMNNSLPLRYSLLMRSYYCINAACEISPSHARLSTLSRIAWEVGQRSIAVQALSNLLNDILPNNRSIAYEEPFLVADPRYELLDPSERCDEWFISSILEQFEKLSCYSSYYSGAQSYRRLQRLCQSRFHSEEIEKRLQLVKQKFYLQ